MSTGIILAMRNEYYTQQFTQQNSPLSGHSTQYPCWKWLIFQ
jgi:hypothetical protein